MYKLLNSSDFEMRSRDLDLNLNFLWNDLKKKDYSKHPLSKMRIRLRLMKYPFEKMRTSIRLQNFRLLTRFRIFSTDPPGINQSYPP